MGVAVIQSLPDKETQTGRKLYEEILKYISFKKTYIENEFFDITDKSDFFSVLKEINEKAVNENKFYFLHFEIHGNNNGVVLKNGDSISWRKLLPYLISLNLFYKNHLSLYLAVCKGLDIAGNVLHTDRAPFSYAIGSFSKVYTDDILKGFEIFYDCFFTGFDISIALTKMNNSLCKSQFTLISCWNIIEILEKIEKENNTKEKVLTLLSKAFSQEINSNKSIEIIYHYLNSEVNRIFDNYKVNRDYFLMKDL